MGGGKWAEKDLLRSSYSEPGPIFFCPANESWFGASHGVSLHPEETGSPWSVGQVRAGLFPELVERSWHKKVLSTKEIYVPQRDQGRE